jgi:hypothetical protein
MSKIKFATILCLALSLPGVRSLYAQSEYGMATVRVMEPANNLYGTPIASIGASLGYGKTFNDSHWGAEYTAFADDLNSRFDFATDKYLTATTIIGGLAITSTYCINPKNKFVWVSGGLSVKAGYNWGNTDVYLSGTDGAKDENLENKTANGGFTVALAPKIMIAFKTANANILGLEFGYDTSSFGTGASKIKSAYYNPPDYNSGYLFVGIFLRLPN